MTGNEIMVKAKGNDSFSSQKSTEPEKEAKIEYESPQQIKRRTKRQKSAATASSRMRIAALLDQVQVFNKDNIPAFKYRKPMKKRITKIFTENVFAKANKGSG